MLTTRRRRTGALWLLLLLLLLDVGMVHSLRATQQQKQPTRFLDDHDSNNTAAVCPPCPTTCPTNNNTSGNGNEVLELHVLVVDSIGIIAMVEWNARDYELVNPGVKIVVQTVPTMPELFQEVENDARNGASLFDAYFTNPVILGAAAIQGGFADLTSFVKSSPHSDWTDVLLALRTYVTSFEEKIYIILLDGDTHTLFYRKDVLDHFGLDVPRTWDEYTEVAKAVNGKTFNGTELYGSCVSRIDGDHAMYWAHLVLSTITQTEGTSTGSLFDTKDMNPLTDGPAMAEMLRIMEEQNLYGAPDEFTKVINYVNNVHMNEGRCVLTYMWGDLFRRSKAQGSILHDKLGIAPTPGSTRVLNRRTGQLEQCTRELCPYAKYYEDLGFVNSAPYAANGGWGAAISANTSPEKQKALADFFLWASSREQAQQYVIPNATLPWQQINGQDPWRKSQLDVEKWVAQGFDRDLSKQYVESILSNLVSKNVVVEARFPKAGEIMSVLDKEVHDYLLRVHQGEVPDADRQQQRLQVAERLSGQWNQIIREYDGRGDTVAPILEVYQRLRGVYVPNEDKNQLDSVRPLGLTLMAIILAFSIGALVWVVKMRNRKVVKASQPIFLGMICYGTLVMGSSILVMGMDDGVVSHEGCNKACMATPWLIAIGFCISFSALFSKIWRLNILMKSSLQFRRIKVSVKDVLLPFSIMLTLNVAFLLTWTIADPLRWERVSKGRNASNDLESYGRCASSSDISKSMLWLIAVTNLVAILCANIQSYLTRNLEVSYNESKFIAFSNVSILQAFLIGLPLLFLAGDNPTAVYLVRSLLVFVVCMSILGFIFIPKMVHTWYPDDAGRNRSVLTSVKRSSAHSHNGLRISGLNYPESAELSKEFSNSMGPRESVSERNTIELSELREEDGSPIESGPSEKSEKAAVETEGAVSIAAAAAAAAVDDPSEEDTDAHLESNVLNPDLQPEDNRRGVAILGHREPEEEIVFHEDESRLTIDPSEPITQPTHSSNSSQVFLPPTTKLSPVASMMSPIHEEECGSTAASHLSTDDDNNAIEEAHAPEAIENNALSSLGAVKTNDDIEDPESNFFDDS